MTYPCSRLSEQCSSAFATIARAVGVHSGRADRRRMWRGWVTENSTPCVENVSRLASTRHSKANGVHRNSQKKIDVFSVEHSYLLCLGARGIQLASKRHNINTKLFCRAADTRALRRKTRTTYEEETSRGSCDGGRLTTQEI